MWIFPVSFLLSVSELWMKDSLRMSSWALAKHRSTDLIDQTTYWLVEEIVDKLHSAGLAVVFLPPALVNLCRSSTQTALAELKHSSSCLWVLLSSCEHDRRTVIDRQAAERGQTDASSLWAVIRWQRGFTGGGVIAEVFHSAWSDCRERCWRLSVWWGHTGEPSVLWSARRSHRVIACFCLRAAQEHSHML